MAAKWGVIGWLTNQGSAPLIEAFTEASADLVVMHNNIVFEALNSVDNYLRIQVRFTHLGHAYHWVNERLNFY
ncbi:putative galactolipase [Helianthus annuus]|nr:putative galactolipase [Helianthus annuus]KAJ0543178.1 putative galactolipase [Helianthus annuus]KAJ0708229.1 putative galactolipase [Helianthus annuus]KAJ0712187.1 putative galactolipase [Helianthus annuus]